MIKGNREASFCESPEAKDVGNEMHLGILGVIHDACCFYHTPYKVYFKQHEACKADGLHADCLFSRYKVGLICKAKATPMFRTCCCGKHVVHCKWLVRKE